MEKYKNKLILERLIMQDNIDEWREWLFLLINMDYNITEQTQALAKIIYQWPGKLTIGLEVSDKKHFEDRESIEGEMFKRRDIFEKEMILFEFEVNIIETYNDLFSYPTYIYPIKDFNTKFEEMRERKNKLEYEENILLGYKSLYESYFRVEKFFESHYLLWSTAEKFLDTKKLWRGLSASSISIEEVVKLK